MSHLNPAEVEATVLSGCMKSVDWLNTCLERLLPIHFKCPRNRQIWLIINDLAKDGSEVTLRKIVDFKGISGDSLTYLLDVYAMSAEFSSLSLVVELLEEALAKTKIAQSMEKAAITLANTTSKAKEVVEVCVNDLFQAISSSKESFSRDLNEILTKPNFMLSLQEKQQQYREGIQVLSGMPTHLLDLDKHLSGLTPGHLTIIGGRPAVGKTTFLVSLIANVCAKNKAKALFFSLEMPHLEVAKKFLSQSSGVPLSKLNDGSLSGQEYQMVNTACQYLKDWNLVIDDQPALLIDQLRARAFRYHKLDKVDIIFIDYIQLLRSSKTESRQLEIADISRKLKEIAKELKIPIVALAQLNRDVEKRDNKTPYISDLRESGAIEADADEILLLHRPEVYDKHDKPGLLKIIVAKNRFGSTGDFFVLFKKETGEMNNYDFKNSKQQDEDQAAAAKKDDLKRFFPYRDDN